jgi:hypothetical protein
VQSSFKIKLRVLAQTHQTVRGTLGRYPGGKIHLDIDPTTTPSRSRAYPIPHSQLKLFKDEPQCLISINVLELRCLESGEWGILFFVQSINVGYPPGVLSFLLFYFER